ncbi:MAG: S41 family peptidase [Planctomycetota bacterium]
MPSETKPIQNPPVAHDRAWPAKLLLALLFAAAPLPWLTAQEATTADASADLANRAKKLIERYGDSDLTRAWRGAQALEQLGDDVIPYVQNLLDGDSTKVQKLLAAKTLTSLGAPEGVDRQLRKLAEDPACSDDERLAAIRLLGSYSGARNEKVLQKLLSSDDAYDPQVRITAAVTLFEMSRDQTTASEALKPLLDVDDPAVRNASALALAQLGYLGSGVKRILVSLENEPTPQGAQARLLLQYDLLMRKLERMMDSGAVTSSPAQNRLIEKLERESRDKDKTIARLRERITQSQGIEGHPLVPKLMEMIDAHYVDPKQVDRDDLVVAAAKGMVASLDPFSSFMDASDTKDFREGMSGEYAGIGARVVKDPDDQTLVITRPVYQGPAYKADILSNDRIVEVEGVRTADVSLDDVLQLLKGKPGTPVNIKIRRYGWTEAQERTILREVIKLDSVYSTMLPGYIGYVHLTQFGDTATAEFEKAVDGLEKLGMKALVFDLRDNPGGLLSAACEIVDQFVPEDERPIVRQRGRDGEAPPRKTTARQRADYPVVVIVNRRSASASEIVSGALQDFERATVVGERTFGKGSVQQLLTLPEEINRILGGESLLRLTIKRYYLPSNRSIHSERDDNGAITKKGGVVPDLAVKPDRIPRWRIDALAKLDADNAFSEYLQQYLEANADEFRQIAEVGDGGDTARYPDFDSFFDARNKYHANPNDIRLRLRERIRRNFEDERGREYACDFADDVLLQRAIVHALKELGSDAREIPGYAPFADRFAQQAKDEGSASTPEEL